MIEMDNTLYQKNLKVLTQVNPELAERVANTKIDNEKYILERSKSGDYTLAILEENGKKKYIHSKYDPKKEARQILENETLKNPKILFVLGIGLGYILQAFFEMKHLTKKMNYLVVVEKDIVIFKISLYLVDYTTLFSNKTFNLLIDIDNESCRIILRDWFIMSNMKLQIKSIEYIFGSNVLLDLYGSYYKKIAESVKETASLALIHFGNDPKDSLIGFEHILKNIDIIISNPGINLFYEKFSNRPCIIISSGPSLDENLELIKEYNEKCIIISADSALKGLMRYGIRPHFVTSLERAGITPLFENLDEFDLNDIILAATPVVERDVYDLYKGPKISVFRKFAHFEWIELEPGIEKGVLDIGASCANLSFKIAEAMGCNPIILCGQDLSYAGKKNTHSSVAKQAEEIQSKYNHFRYLDVPSNNGGMVRTHHIWLQFLRAFDNDVSKTNATIYNTSLHGAKIQNTIVRPLSDILHNDNLNFFANVREDVFNIYNLYSTDLIQDFNIIEMKLQNGKKFLEILTEKINYQLKSIEKLEKKITNLNITKISDVPVDFFKKQIKKINKFEKEELSSQKLFYYIVAHIIQSFFISSQIEIQYLPSKYDDENTIYHNEIAIKKNTFTTFKQILYMIIDYINDGYEKIEKIKEKV